METRNSLRKKWVQGVFLLPGNAHQTVGTKRMCVCVCMVCYVYGMYACLLPANYKADNDDVTETSTRASMVALRFSLLRFGWGRTLTGI